MSDKPPPTAHTDELSGLTEQDLESLSIRTTPNNHRYCRIELSLDVPTAIEALKASKLAGSPSLPKFLRRTLRERLETGRLLAVAEQVRRDAETIAQSQKELSIGVCELYDIHVSHHNYFEGALAEQYNHFDSAIKTLRDNQVRMLEMLNKLVNANTILIETNRVLAQRLGDTESLREDQSHNNQVAEIATIKT